MTIYNQTQNTQEEIISFSELDGIWIPIQIWRNKNLTQTEKVLLVEINYFDNSILHCYASDNYLAQLCECSPSTVKRGIKKLIAEGYIKHLGYRGKSRILQSNIKHLVKQKNTNLNTNSNNYIHNNNHIHSPEVF